MGILLPGTRSKTFLPGGVNWYDALAANGGDAT